MDNTIGNNTGDDINIDEFISFISDIKNADTKNIRATQKLRTANNIGKKAFLQYNDGFVSVPQIKPLSDITGADEK